MNDEQIGACVVVVWWHGGCDFSLLPNPLQPRFLAPHISLSIGGDREGGGMGTSKCTPNGGYCLLGCWLLAALPFPFQEDKDQGQGSHAIYAVLAVGFLDLDAIGEEEENNRAISLVVFAGLVAVLVERADRNSALLVSSRFMRRGMISEGSLTHSDPGASSSCV